MKTKKVLRSICSIALAIICCVSSVSPIPTRAAYITEKSIDFSVATDADLFSTSDGGYSIVDGVFKPNNTWANTYLTDPISLATNKVISFDFCLQDDNASDHQFNVGLTNVDGDTFTNGISWHFHYSSDFSVELVTLNSVFGNSTDGWITDTVADYFDGQTHTMTITITDKTASFKIDGNDVLKSAAVGLDAPYLVFQSTSTEYFIDNVKIEEEEPQKPAVPEYSEKDIDFDAVSDADVFASSDAGWNVKNGVYQANSAWATTYLNCKVPLNEEKEINFDFCLKNNGDENHQFNFAFVDIEGDIVSTDFAGHFYKHAQHGELFTLNRQFGSPTGSGWIGDNTDNYNDGNVHTMHIQIKDGKATIYIDKKVVFQDVSLSMTNAFFIMQFTSVDSYVDNFKVKDTLSTITEDSGNTPGTNPNPDPDPDPDPTYHETSIDFDVVSDADVFASSDAGWNVKNGVYQANSAWATTYLNYKIPLNEEKEISFDFCLNNNGDENHQFNFAFVDIEGDAVTTDFAGHFYHHAQHGELFTLNREFGSPTGSGWIGDNTDNYNDGNVHTMHIQIKNSKATIYIDKKVVFQDVPLSMTNAFFMMQFTSVDSYVDNFKVQDTLSTITEDSGNMPGTNPNLGTTPDPEPTYHETSLDFDAVSDADVFASNDAGWDVKNGVYKANGAWATTYLNYRIPLNEDKEISFDFCLKNKGDVNHQFNFAFVDMKGDTVTTDFAGHFYCHAQHGELLTLNRDFGNPTGNGWIGDNTDNYNDGKVHTMHIQIKGSKATIYIDKKVVFQDVSLSMTSAFFMMQFTSVDSYVDNFKVADALTTITADSGNTPGSNSNPATSPELTYREVKIDFDVASDANVFATNNGGWIVKNGVYQPSIAWATTYFNFKIPFNEDKQISFDFCLKNNGDKNHQFNLGFVDIDGMTVSKGLSGHIFNHAQHGELFTLNRDFGNPVGESWIADNTDNFNDGKVHNMLIQIQDGKVKFCIDKKVIFQDVELERSSAYFILQATSVDTYVDNIILSNTLTDISKYDVSTQSAVTAAPVVSTVGATSYKYKEMSLDFSAAKDGDAFATNNWGWSVSDGVYKPNEEWATTYLNCLIPLNGEKEITFDFCMKDVDDKAHQFNVGFVNPNGDKLSTVLAGHFYHHAQYGELFTLNRDYGNPIGEGWIADNTDNFNDGEVHSMMIRVKDSKVAFYIDGEEIFTEIPLNAESAYFILQFTSVESYIDNFRISDTLTYIPDYPVNTPEPEGDEVADTGVAEEELKPTDGKVTHGMLPVIIGGASIVLLLAIGGIIILKKRKQVKINE